MIVLVSSVSETITSTIMSTNPERDEGRCVPLFLDSRLCRFVRDASAVSVTVLASPAKINLYLAVTGRRTDGFHNLVSVVAPLAWGDLLQIETGEHGDFSLTCDDPAVPCDDANLVLKAARVFQEASGWKRGARFHLQKRIPMGAGLGGGSSNAVASLRGLNALAGEPLSENALAELAARLGSDCMMFLHDGPVVMRGRGERVEALPSAIAARLSGQRVLLFKPSFGIGTPWAYGRLASLAKAEKGAAVYLPEADAEAPPRPLAERSQRVRGFAAL